MIRQPLTGAISGTTLGKTSESLTPDEFGAVGSWQASFDGALQIDRTLEHDDLGRIYKQTETLVGETHVDEYFYDAALRLYRWSRDGADVATYDYDDDGNRTTGGAVFDAQDRLTADSSATYSHDLLGRRTARMAAGAMTIYRWDGLDRLVGVDLPDGKVRDYVYDGVGARIAGRTNGSVTER